VSIPAAQKATYNSQKEKKNKTKTKQNKHSKGKFWCKIKTFERALTSNTYIVIIKNLHIAFIL